jgi:hypothetical protein
MSTTLSQNVILVLYVKTDPAFGTGIPCATSQIPPLLCRESFIQFFNQVLLNTTHLFRVQTHSIHTTGVMVDRLGHYNTNYRRELSSQAHISQNTHTHRSHSCSLYAA